MTVSRLHLAGSAAHIMLAHVGLDPLGRRGAHFAPFDGNEGELVRQIKESSTKLDAATEAVKRSHEEITKQVKDHGDATTEAKQKADQALTKMGELSTMITEIEQKLAKGFGGRDEIIQAAKSLGQEMTTDEKLVAWAKENAHTTGDAKISFNTKSVTQHKGSKAVAPLTTIGTGDGNGGQLIRPDRLPGILMLPDFPLTVRDLLSSVATTNNAVEWVLEQGFVNNAAMVDENPALPKPQSGISFTMQSTTVKTMAHWMKASRQVLADVPQLSDIIDNRLRYGLAFTEDQQLLLGDGNGNNLKGIMPWATAYSDPSNGDIKNAMGTAAATRIDVMRLAMLQATVGLYPATGHVMHPIDWTIIEMTKDTQGRYIIGQPQGTIGATMWGLPVVATQAMPVGWFITGALKLACQIYDREQANVRISTEDQDNFVKNMVTILAEERLGFAVTRPQAIIKGQFKTILAGMNGG